MSHLTCSLLDTVDSRCVECETAFFNGGFTMKNTLLALTVGFIATSAAYAADPQPTVPATPAPVAPANAKTEAPVPVAPKTQAPATEKKAEVKPEASAPATPGTAAAPKVATDKPAAEEKKPESKQQ